VRKTIETCADLCQACDLTEWCQSAYHVRQFKKSYRPVQRLKHSHSQDEAKRSAPAEDIQEAHRAHLEPAEGYLARAREIRGRLHTDCGLPTIRRAPQLGQVPRRLQLLS